MYKRRPINCKSLHNISMDKIEVMEFGFVTFCGWFHRMWQVKDTTGTHRLDT